MLRVKVILPRLLIEADPVLGILYNSLRDFVRWALAPQEEKRERPRPFLSCLTAFAPSCYTINCNYWVWFSFSQLLKFLHREEIPFVRYADSSSGVFFSTGIRWPIFEAKSLAMLRSRPVFISEMFFFSRSIFHLQ